MYHKAHSEPIEKFKKLLQFLGFREDKNNVLSKNYGALLPCFVEVDFEAQKITYPEEIKYGDATTLNFEHPENFVVCECVCRLLAQGYRPEHLELEKRWKLGHEEKSGKADICVYDQEGKMLLIIECKTYGTEYAKERQRTLQDGGQLFSYWQQEGSTQWLALYASDFQDGKIIHECEVIRSTDDANVVELAKKDDSYRLFKNAHSVAELFEVWDETYNKTFYPDLIFSKDSVAYQIGVRPLRKCDLKEFKAEDKIVNRFEEILRHNNVSDKENAFNRLTALFICKLVDEIGKSDGDELEFQYKQGTDTYETLQDRLQRLHQEGMEKFMREKIFYVSNDYPDQLLAQYAKQKRQAMIEDLRNTIRILKFYSNNDFSFKDVHNEELFLQNGKILVEVVQLFERYRIVYNSKEQFLGDLFEQLLNKGFKQNEGQFFTPIPITRFIWDSLPLESVIHNAGKYNLPKVIDFACGAGHFLTEAVEAINAFLDHTNQAELKKENAWVEKSIFGIEKDYRLARVSKISLFMNGAGYGNIIFGDGLDNYPDKGIAPGTFDILVANPPYSIAAFKEHLKLKNNCLELADKITNTGSEIEVLFVERISQLLKPQGIAAVILPASILSNSSSSYIGARESLLENFKIRAIVQFGSKTFGATGTNTVVLFLEKYDEPPKRKEMVKDSAQAIQANAALADWEDLNILNAYLAQIEVSAEDYRKFYAKDQQIDVWREHPYFGQYVKSFDDLPEIRKKKSQKSFQQQAEELQRQILQIDFYRYVCNREYEKLRFFALVYNQMTLVVTAPANNDEQKEFLGYDWSNRKGAEGIQILNSGGKLYCNADRCAPDSTAAMIRSAFAAPLEPPVDLEQYCVWRNLRDMIDFSRVDFNKEIKPSVAKKIIIKSKWQCKSLGEIAPFCNDRVLFASIKQESYITTDNMLQKREGIVPYTGPVISGNVISYQKNDILISNIRPYLKKIWLSDRDGGCSPDVLVFHITDPMLLLPQYLYQILAQDVFFEFMMSGKNGVKMPRGDKNIIPSYPIPIPPIDIQKNIVKECEERDNKIKKYRQEISSVKADLLKLFETTQTHSIQTVRLLNENLFQIFIGRRVLDKDVTRQGEIPVYSANVFEPFGYIDKLLMQDFTHSSILWSIDGDWMVNCLPAGQKFYPTDHCGVIRILTDTILPEYFMLVLQEAGKKERFSRTLRASTDRIRSLMLSFPAVEEQQHIVTLFRRLKDTEERAKSTQQQTEELKKLILEKWL